MVDNELLTAIADLMDKKLEPIQADVSGLKEDMLVVKSDVSGLKEGLVTLQADMKETKQRLTAIEMTIENEISHNIKIIGEGHLDLSRKLNEAIHIASDVKAKQEIQDLYIKTHNSMLKIKEISL